MKLSRRYYRNETAKLEKAKKVSKGASKYAAKQRAKLKKEEGQENE